ETSPASKISSGFKSERIPNPGDFLSSVSNRVLFFCKATIMSSNTSIHELASKFGLASRFSGRSWAELAAFGAS
ncbi:hypothetical protein PIB30_090481, partial [Stylosanthes scabra]|nr:hypothetical protein [Stylosanthes scabra]